MDSYDYFAEQAEGDGYSEGYEPSYADEEAEDDTYVPEVGYETPELLDREDDRDGFDEMPEGVHHLALSLTTEGEPEEGEGAYDP